MAALMVLFIAGSAGQDSVREGDGDTCQKFQEHWAKLTVNREDEGCNYLFGTEDIAQQSDYNHFCFECGEDGAFATFSEMLTNFGNIDHCDFIPNTTKKPSELMEEAKNYMTGICLMDEAGATFCYPEYRSFLATLEQNEQQQNGMQPPPPIPLEEMCAPCGMVALAHARIFYNLPVGGDRSTLSLPPTNHDRETSLDMDVPHDSQPDVGGGGGNMAEEDVVKDGGDEDEVNAGAGAAAGADADADAVIDTADADGFPVDPTAGEDQVDEDPTGDAVDQNEDPAADQVQPKQRRTLLQEDEDGRVDEPGASGEGKEEEEVTEESSGGLNNGRDGEDRTSAPKPEGGEQRGATEEDWQPGAAETPAEPEEGDDRDVSLIEQHLAAIKCRCDPSCVESTPANEAPQLDGGGKQDTLSGKKPESEEEGNGNELVGGQLPEGGFHKAPELVMVAMSTTLTMTEEDFEGRTETYLAAVAMAFQVEVDKVTLVSVLSLTEGRRLLSLPAGGIKVETQVELPPDSIVDEIDASTVQAILSETLTEDWGVTVLSITAAEGSQTVVAENDSSDGNMLGPTASVSLVAIWALLCAVF